MEWMGTSRVVAIFPNPDKLVCDMSWSMTGLPKSIVFKEVGRYRLRRILNTDLSGLQRELRTLYDNADKSGPKQAKLQKMFEEQWKNRKIH